MKSDGLTLSRTETLAFLGDDVQKAWATHRLHILQSGHQRINIVTINRSDVIEAQFLEQRTRHNHSFEMLLPSSGKSLHRRSRSQYGFAAFAYAGICPSREDAGEIVRHGSDIPGYRHLVVVQNHQQVRIHITRVVKCLHRLTCG